MAVLTNSNKDVSVAAVIIANSKNEEDVRSSAWGAVRTQYQRSVHAVSQSWDTVEDIFFSHTQPVAQINVHSTHHRLHVWVRQHRRVGQHVFRIN